MSKGPKVGEKKKFNLPHVFIILFAIMIICAIATYIIPAGSYDYVENDMGRNVAVPGSWHPVDDAKPVGPFRLFELVYEGMVNAADISFLVFITYCSVTFIIKSGAFEGAQQLPCYHSYLPYRYRYGILHSRYVRRVVTVHSCIRSHLHRNGI